MSETKVTSQEIDFTTMLLASVPKTTDFSSATTANHVQVTGLTASVTLLAGASYEISVFASNCYQNSGGGAFEVGIWDGVVNSGTQLARVRLNNVSGANNPVNVAAIVPAGAGGAKTYNVGLKAGAGTATFEAGATYPAFLLIKRIG